MSTQANLPPLIEQAGLALREVLLRLDAYSKKRVQTIDTSSHYATAAMQHVRDLDELMTAVQTYEEAIITCLLLANSDDAPIYQMSAEELLAHRQANPLYQLGWVCGHKAGLAQGEQSRDRALSVYAQHAVLPEPSDSSPLIKRVRLLLGFWQETAPPTATRLNTLRQQLAACSLNNATLTPYGTV
jgi:hypothetical protein